MQIVKFLRHRRNKLTCDGIVVSGLQASKTRNGLKDRPSSLCRK